MTAKRSDKSKSARDFAGCVEVSPSQPLCVEFIESGKLWGFPTNTLLQFSMTPNPGHEHNKKASPPDQLMISYLSAEVVVKGWRLELLVSALVTGKLARIHAEKHLGPLIIDQPWVSEIHVQPKARPGNVSTNANSPAKN